MKTFDLMEVDEFRGVQFVEDVIGPWRVVVFVHTDFLGNSVVVDLAVIGNFHLVVVVDGVDVVGVDVVGVGDLVVDDEFDVVDDVPAVPAVPVAVVAVGQKMPLEANGQVYSPVLNGACFDWDNQKSFLCFD